MVQELYGHIDTDGITRFCFWNFTLKLTILLYNFTKFNLNITNNVDGSAFSNHFTLLYQRWTGFIKFLVFLISKEHNTSYEKNEIAVMCKTVCVCLPTV